MIRSWPATKTFDTLHACDMASKEFLTFEELKHEYRRYLMGDYAPHYPVPAISYVLHNERGNIWSWSHGWFMTIRDRYNSHRVLRVFKS